MRRHDNALWATTAALWFATLCAGQVEDTVRGQTAGSGQEHRFVTQYTYYGDAPLAGLVRTRTDPAGRVTTYEYNQGSQLTKVCYADGKTVEYVYDKLGRRTAMHDWTGTSAYEYDTLSRLAKMTQSNGLWVRFEYDWLDRIAAIIVPGDPPNEEAGWRVAYAYNLLGNLAAIDSPVGRFTWEYDYAAGTVTRRMPNGVISAFHYQPDGLLERIRHEREEGAGDMASRALLIEFAYAYQPDRRLSNETVTSADGTQQTTGYRYDRVGRLVEVKRSDGGTVAYSYDAMGNRLSQVTPDGEMRYEYDRWDQILRAGGETFTHDACGNVVRRASEERTVAYEYDCRDNLLAVRSPAGAVAYVYDGDGLRTSRIRQTERTDFLTLPSAWGSLVLIAQDNLISNRYVVTGAGQYLACQTPGQVEFFLEDRLGSVRALVDEEGYARVLEYRDVFGHCDAPHSTLPHPSYACLLYDPLSKLHLTTARAYAADLSRFLQRDPVLFGEAKAAAGRPPYTYCHADPINFVDTDGKDERPVSDNAFADYVNEVPPQFADLPTFDYGLGLGVGSGAKPTVETAEEADGRFPIVVVWGHEQGAGADLMRATFWDSAGGARRGDRRVPVGIRTFVAHSAGAFLAPRDVSTTYLLDPAGHGLAEEDVHRSGIVSNLTSVDTGKAMERGVIGVAFSGRTPVEAVQNLGRSLIGMVGLSKGLAKTLVTGDGPFASHALVPMLNDLEEKGLIPKKNTYDTVRVLYLKDGQWKHRIVVRDNGEWRLKTDQTTPPTATPTSGAEGDGQSDGALWVHTCHAGHPGIETVQDTMVSMSLRGLAEKETVKIITYGTTEEDARSVAESITKHRADATVIVRWGNHDTEALAQMRIEEGADRVLVRRSGPQEDEAPAQSETQGRSEPSSAEPSRKPRPGTLSKTGKLAVNLSGGPVVYEDDEWVITATGEPHWFDVRNRTWAEGVPVYNGTNQSADVIVAAVLQMAERLGVAKGEKIVVGGDPNDPEYREVVRRLEDEGYVVVECHFCGMTAVAETAKAVGAKVGVVVTDTNDVPKTPMESEGDGEEKRRKEEPGAPPHDPGGPPDDDAKDPDEPDDYDDWDNDDGHDGDDGKKKKEKKKKRKKRKKDSEDPKGNEGDDARDDDGVDLQKEKREVQPDLRSSVPEPALVEHPPVVASLPKPIPPSPPRPTLWETPNWPDWQPYQPPPLPSVTIPRFPPPWQTRPWNYPGSWGWGGGTMALDATRVGGVRLDKTAQVLGQLGTISAANFDARTGRLMLVGEKTTALPAVRTDDLAAVIHSIYVEGTDPWLSIDPKEGDVWGPKMNVVYSPGLAFTHAGKVMYEADYKLKEYAAGGRGSRKLTSRVPQWRCLAELERELFPEGRKDDGRIWYRFWLKPGDTTLRLSDDGTSLTFDRATVQVETENMLLQDGRLVPVHDVKDPVAERFAELFTEHYDAFAAECPVYEELRQLAQVVALAKWMYEEGIEINLGWVDRCLAQAVETPLETDAIWAERVVPGDVRGADESIHRFFGGVQLSMRLRRGSVSLATAQPGAGIGLRSEEDMEQDRQRAALRCAVEAAQLPAEKEELAPTDTSSRRAVVLPGVARRLLGAYRTQHTDLIMREGQHELSLVRHYDSLANDSTPFGHGWQVTTLRLYRRMPLRDDERVILCQPDGGEVLLPIYRLTDNLQTIEEDFIPDARAASHGMVRYRPRGVGVAHRIDVLPEGEGFRIDLGGRRVWQFDGDGYLREQRRWNTRVEYEYDRLAGGRRRLARILSVSKMGEAVSTVGLAFEYDKHGRVSRVFGSDGSQVMYNYDASGDLVDVQTPGGQLTYAYDANHLLLGTGRDGVPGQLIIYDDDGRLNAIYGADGRKHAEYAIELTASGETVVLEKVWGTRLTYDDRLQLMSALTPGAGRAQYTYYEDGGIQTIEYENEAGCVTCTAYSRDGRTTDTQTPAGASLRHTVDEAGRPSSLHLNGQRLVELDYLVGTTKVEEARFPTFRWRRLFEGDQLEREILTAYSASGWQQERLDVRYAQGRVVGLSGPGGLRVAYAYEGDRLAGISSPRQTLRVIEESTTRTMELSGGRRVSVQRDQAGRVAWVRKQIGESSAEALYSDGRLTKFRAHDGGETRYDWDGSTGLLSSVTSPNGSRVSYDYKQVGETWKLSSVALPSGRSIAFLYDERGRVAKILE